MKTFSKLFFFLPASLFLFSACDLHPDDEFQFISDSDAIITLYDDEADFSSVKTYVIVDSVRQISDDDSGSPVADNGIGKENSDEILSMINDNMEDMGYELVTNPEDAHVAINVGTVVVTNLIVYQDYYYGCGLFWCDPGYWYGYPGYGYYYPWYPDTYVTSYKVGTMVIEIIDLKNVDESEQQVNVIWKSIVNGVVTENNTSMLNRAEKGIDQAFDQSPYLKN